MGCFWGAERVFWMTDGVFSTAVGYAGGTTSNPSYEDVCSGRTGHTEAVLVVFDPAVVSFDDLLKRFWEAHDPTQGMRQGPDRGSQYRSAIYTTTDAQYEAALASRDRYAEQLARPDSVPSRPRSSRPWTSSTPRSITSSTLAKNLARTGVDLETFYFGVTPAPAHPIAAEGYCGMEPHRCRVSDRSGDEDVRTLPRVVGANERTGLSRLLGEPTQVVPTLTTSVALSEKLFHKPVPNAATAATNAIAIRQQAVHIQPFPHRVGR